MERFELNYKRDFDVSLNWDTLLVCNQKCYYCYARPSHLWGKIQPKEITNKVIDTLRDSDLSFKVCLLGGEPTLHPRIAEIIRKLDALENVRYIELFTNTRKLLSKVLKGFRSDKLTVNLSFHITENPPLDVLDDNIRYCRDNNLKFNIFLMIPQEEKYIYSLKEIYQKYKENVKVNYITTDDVTSAKVHFENEKEDTFLIDDKVISASEVLNKGLHDFKGMYCDRSDYTINVDGSIDNMCISQVGNITHFTFKKNTVICDRDCGNACWMETKKWR